MIDLLDLDAVIGFGKPASKTADWIVNTYLPNAPVSYRLSIEHAIATAIIEVSGGKHASAHAGKQGDDPRIPGLVNGIRSLVLFHTKNGTMHGDCASDFAELVAPYPSYAPSGEVINEQAAAPVAAGKK